MIGLCLQVILVYALFVGLKHISDWIPHCDKVILE